MNERKERFMSRDRSLAEAIVRIFETGRAERRYAALAVLNDGAGISYGISQFTHRSGSLARVVERYLALDGRVAAHSLAAALPRLRSTSLYAIRGAADDARLKTALRSAAITREMREAQHDVAYERYMAPALRACAGSGFSEPLSLAVVYDSITHGSWEFIRDRVRITRGTDDAAAFERRWIAAYVRTRHEWLRSIPRLRSTAYRTAFFLREIAAGNWQLELPLTVHGVTLPGPATTPKPDPFPTTRASTTREPAADVPPTSPQTEGDGSLPAEAASSDPSPAESLLERAERITGTLTEGYGRLGSVLRDAVPRADSVKSMWTTIGGTAWQSTWAVASFFLGLPGEVWLVVAVIAALLMLFYLYRQFELGRIREIRGGDVPAAAQGGQEQ